jgi:hypothetical protein
MSSRVERTDLMELEKITQVFTVRDRPVGYRAGRWGGALVAVERGDFPISPTGYRSLCGLAREAVTPGFLEDLARAHERERQGVLQRLREAHQPVGSPISNYIQASSAYESAAQYGFFASNRERAALWSGAHQLLCRVNDDARFQPAPDRTFVAWTKEHCEASLVRARELKALLGRLAAGDFPEELPVRLLGVQSYLALPARPGGEPRIELGGYTAEMALGLPAVSLARRPMRTVAKQDQPTSGLPEAQLGLFDPGPSVATKPREAPQPAPKLRI